MIRGGILQRLQGRICLERLGQVLRARGTDAVVVEAANESRVGVLMAAITVTENQAQGRRGHTRAATTRRVMFIQGQAKPEGSASRLVTRIAQTANTCQKKLFTRV